MIDDVPAFTEVIRLIAAHPVASGETEPNGGALKFRSRLELRDVVVRYPGAERPVLGPITLSVECGQSIGIIGPTGAGKTTLLEVLAGLIVPTEGSITLDGCNLDKETSAAWRRAIGYVAQDVFIFDDTIAANVVCGRTYDEAKLERALASAALKPFVASLPEGAATPLGSFGDLLSGGQRQRIGIARAVYHEPDILFLDEATAGLDVHTEAQVLTDIQRRAGRLTRIIVAHRLSAVANCDNVILLEGGRVKSIGPPGEVLAGFAALAGGHAAS
jgi:ATP-binding cassette subfamily C protein